LNVIMETMPRPRVFDESVLKEDFLSSSCTLKELASRHNASYSLVSKLASTQNWTKKREEYRKTIARTHIGVVQPEFVATQHIDRSICTGNQLHQLIQEATKSIKVGDIRSLKTLVDAWSGWDNQMRKAHRLDEEKGESLINIQLLGSLPDEPNYIYPERVESAELSDK